MNGSEELHCMNCRHAWTDDYVYSVMTTKFYKGDYRKHHMDILIEREKSLLPSTQDAVTTELKRRDNEKQAALIAGEILNKRSERNTLDRQILHLRHPTKDPEFEVYSRCTLACGTKPCRGWNVIISTGVAKCFVCKNEIKNEINLFPRVAADVPPPMGVEVKSMQNIYVQQYIHKKQWGGARYWKKEHCKNVPYLAIRRNMIQEKYDLFNHTNASTRQGRWGNFILFAFDALFHTRSQLINSHAWKPYLNCMNSDKKPKTIESRLESIRLAYLLNEITWSEMCDQLLSVNARYENTKTQYQLLCMYVECCNFLLQSVYFETEGRQVGTPTRGWAEHEKLMNEYEELRVFVNKELAKVNYKPCENGTAHIYSRTWRLSLGWHDVQNYIPEEMLEGQYKKYTGGVPYP